MGSHSCIQHWYSTYTGIPGQSPIAVFITGIVLMLCNSLLQEEASCQARSREELLIGGQSFEELGVFDLYKYLVCMKRTVSPSRPNQSSLEMTRCRFDRIQQREYKNLFFKTYPSSSWALKDGYFDCKSIWRVEIFNSVP
ncbi:uncharacterized protein [Macrobrachium rosenbergii]|uniref:uncharacterized protein n=1 Tax=Macrobrachium rosenbergii TaxID=79674 RepID=UPI0034D4A6F0